MAMNRRILVDMKAASCHDMLSALETVDQDLLRATIAGDRFGKLFDAYSQDEEMSEYLRSQ